MGPLRVSTILIAFTGIVLLGGWTPHSEDFLQEIVYTLSSNEFEGRRAGQEGNLKATQYLIQQIQNKELQAHPVYPKYEQAFTIFTEMKKQGPNDLYALKNHQHLKAPFEPLAYSQSGEITQADIVFVGFGITHKENSWSYDDYQNIDVENKIVVVLSGDPAIGSENSPFKNPKYYHYRTLTYKLQNAIQHKAKGFLYLTHPLSFSPSPEPDLSFKGTDGGGNRFSILAGQIKNQFFNSLIQNSELNTSLKLQKKILQTQKPFSFSVPNYKGNLQVHLKRLTGRVSNIIAYSPGTTKENIVIGAHFDHLGFGGDGSMNPDHNPYIHPGADDNASGTALVLSLAEKLKNVKHKENYIFVLFNAEEMGLLGSDHFANTWERLKRTYGPIKAMINFDMVGRLDEKLDIIAVRSAQEWENYIQITQDNIQRSEKSKLRLSLNLGAQNISSSDHSSFLYKKIPSLFMTTGAHEDYHRSSDTFDKLNMEALPKIRHLVLELLKSIEGQTITFNPDGVTAPPNTGEGERASLGCVPQFGQPDPHFIGVLCKNLVPNSPAQQAGMIPKDVIVRLGDIDINNIYDLSFALKYYHAGDKMILKWRRGDNVYLEKKVELKKK